MTHQGMTDNEIKTAMFVIAIFSAGAVALILYQHASHTGQIMAAVAPPSGAPTADPKPNSGLMASGPASLAGQPTIGQANLQPQVVPTSSMQINPGFGIGMPGQGTGAGMASTNGYSN